MVSLGLLIRVSQTGAVTVKKALDEIGESSKKTTSAVSSLRAAFSTLVAGFGIAEVFRTADTYQVLQNRLKLVTSSIEEQAAMWTRLNNIADDSYSSVENTVQLYAKAAYAFKNYGKSAEDAAEFTDLFQKAAVLSGSSVQTTSQAVYQFTQALNKGKLDGDEFKSVLEGLPYVAQLIQKELGATRAELYAMSEAGEITVDQVIRAFEQAAKTIRDDFGNVVPTVGLSLVLLNNAWTEFIGSIQESTGIFTIIAELIILVANNLGLLIAVLTPVAAAFVYLAGRTAIGLTILALQQFAEMITLTVIPAVVRLTAVIWANPLMWIPAAIALAVTAIVWLVTNVNLLAVAFNLVKTAVMAAWDFIVSGITMIATGFADWFVNLQIVQDGYAALSNAAATAANMVINAWNNVYNGLMILYKAITSSLIPVWKQLKPAISEVIEVLKDLAEFVMNVLVAAFVDFWEKDVKPIWTEFMEETKLVRPILMELAKYVSVGLVAAFIGAFKIITAIIEGVIFVIRSFIALIQQAIQMLNTLTGMGGPSVGGGGGATGPGFATGGSFKVGGTGAGRDQTQVAFRANRGEEVEVRTRKQQRQADNFNGKPEVKLNVKINNMVDKNDILEVMSGPEGEQVILNKVKINKHKL